MGADSTTHNRRVSGDKAVVKNRRAMEGIQTAAMSGRAANGMILIPVIILPACCGFMAGSVVFNLNIVEIGAGA